jgi:hypothetical protein
MTKVNKKIKNTTMTKENLTIEIIREKLTEVAKEYPNIRERISNENGLVYCANRISHMIETDNCNFAGASAWLESELEGMD